MLWSAQVTFEAATQADAASEINTWSLPPGSTVTIMSLAPPVTGTVDDGGNVVPDAPPEPPPA